MGSSLNGIGNFLKLAESLTAAQQPLEELEANLENLKQKTEEISKKHLLKLVQNLREIKELLKKQRDPFLLGDLKLICLRARICFKINEILSLEKMIQINNKSEFANTLKAQTLEKYNKKCPKRKAGIKARP